MIKIIVTHKKGVKLTAPRIEQVATMPLARELAKRHEWDGTMTYLNTQLPLRASR
ncbi:hypothetical protein [Alishewanella phage vB_AspM_Slicko01]|nr:hypothetical protein [Alishewanella phage vB_AspM_Slicko01]